MVGQDGLPAKYSSVHPVQILLFLMPYKLNSEEYSLTVVQLKIQKEKRLDCVLDFIRAKHKNDHQKPRVLYLSSASVCGELSRIEFYQLHFIPNLAISDSLLCLYPISVSLWGRNSCIGQIIQEIFSVSILSFLASSTLAAEGLTNSK